MGLDHEAVIRSHTPERYILGELPPRERDEFEEHLADCRMCMQEVRAMDIFAANASGVYADEEATKTETEKKAAKPGWLDFLRPRTFPALAFSGALNLVLLAGVGVGVARYATLLEPRPGVTAVFTVHPPARTGESQICPVSTSSAFATLRFDLSQRYQRYSYSLEGAGQSSLDAPHDATQDGTQPPAAETLNLTVAVEGLKPGDHKFQLTGWDGKEQKPIGECVLRVEQSK